MTPLSIALLGDFYTSWMGGANILGFLLNGLLKAAPAQCAQVHLLMDARQLPPALQHDIRDFLPLARAQIEADGALRCLIDSVPALPHLLFYKDLPATLDALGIDVVGPSGQHLGAGFPRPWFAYIPDFQHQHLPHFFSAGERRARDAHYRALVEDAAGVFVNSATVAADIGRFYAGAARRQRVFRLPQVYPDVTSALDDRRDAVLARHDVRGPYLLSCSQRWLHKQHGFIVEAFAEHLRACPDSPLQLIFTGEAHDHRDPAHGADVEAAIDRLGLRARVRHLGLLPRADQLQLIAGAHALLQASLFEGGPGASGTLEAALLGTPVLASDIEANRELAFGRSVFFDAALPSALARAIDAMAVIDTARDAPFTPEQIEFLTLASGLQTIAALRSALH